MLVNVNKYHFPPRRNRGIPPNKFPPGDPKVVRYPIVHYVLTMHLPCTVQGFVNCMSNDTIRIRVREALTDPKWVKSMA